MIGDRARNEERARFLIGSAIAEREQPGNRGAWLSDRFRVVGIVGVVFAVLGCILGSGTAIAAAAVGVVSVMLRRGRLRFNRIEAFESDYPTLLIALASSVRAGLDPLVALTSAATLFPPQSILRRELDRFARSIESGEEEESAVRSFGRSVEHPDVVLLQNAYLIARREGSSLGECLHRLARVTRQRQSFRRKMRAAVAMQRLSALGIAGCAVVIGVFQSVTNARGVAAALADPRGVAALSFGGCLIVGGLLWMAYVVRARV